MDELKNIFKALSDETRLRCLVLLKEEGELCVCQLHGALDISQPKMSRHLATLKKLDILSSKNKGTWKHYQINPKLKTTSLNIINETYKALKSTKPFSQDIKRLKQNHNHCQTRDS